MTVRRRNHARIPATIATSLVVVLGLAACFGPSAEAPVAEPTAAPPVVQSADLSNEAAALQDLRGCLAIKSAEDVSVLNVFYLIDNSGSLDDPKNPSDPQGNRIEILKRSLDSLSELGDRVQLNWAAATFSDDFDQPTTWATYGPEANGQALAAVIPTDAKGFTNWELAVRGAQQSLAEQQLAVPGCALLIWFTDGLINIGDDEVATSAAVDQLCGTPNGSAGLVQQLRSEQVVVFGVLLNKSAGPEAAKLLTKLVEGEADPEDQVDGSCGIRASTDVHGTVTVVSEVGDLAAVFDQLPLTLDGGRLGEDIDPVTGDFLVPVGVSRFVIQFAPRSEAWALRTPNGVTLTQGDLDWPEGLSVSARNNGDKASVDVQIDSSEFNGLWTIVNYIPGEDALFRFSDLEVVLDDLEGANLGVVSGEGSTLTGIVLDRAGSPAPLELYTFDWVIQERLPGEPLPRDLPSDTSDDDEARFTIDLGSTNAEPGDRMRVVITLAELRTIDGNVPLEGPSVSLLLTVLRPDQVPSDIRILFTDPAGSSSVPARGEIVAEPSVDGTTVGVVVREDALIERVDRFDREFLIGASGSGCEQDVAICGQFTPTQRAVPISIGIAPDEKPQYSSITGELLIELVVPPDSDASSAQPVRVIKTLPFTLETERPINLALLLGLLLGLLLLGFALPIVLAWALKRILVWIQHGRLLQRAEFPVIIKDGALTVTDIDLSDEAAVVSGFRNLAPNDQVRSHKDARLGSFDIRVPAHPLAAAWFSLTPPTGTRVIAQNTGSAPRKYSADISSGRLVATNGVLPGAWAVAINERDLSAAGKEDPLAGILVVYLQPVQGEQGQYGKRLLEIVTVTDWRARVRDIGQAVALDAARPTSSVSTDTTGAEPAARPGMPRNLPPASPPEPARPPGRPAPPSSGSMKSARPAPLRSPRDTPNDPPPRPPGR